MDYAFISCVMLFDKLYLGSQSPRRGELCSVFFNKIKYLSLKGDEPKWNGESPEKYLKTCINYKISSCEQEIKPAFNGYVLAADTIVQFQGQVLGKPENNQQALQFLKRLSGQAHLVKTIYSVWFVNKKKSSKKITKTISSKVIFKKLPLKTIKDYVSSKEPFGKAGGYALQGGGACFVEKIVGSYSNILGLPILEVLKDVKKLNAAR